MMNILNTAINFFTLNHFKLITTYTKNIFLDLNDLKNFIWIETKHFIRKQIINLLSTIGMSCTRIIVFCLEAKRLITEKEELEDKYYD